VFFRYSYEFFVSPHTKGASLSTQPGLSRPGVTLRLPALATIQFREQLTETWSAEEDQLGLGAECHFVRIAEGLLH